MTKRGKWLTGGGMAALIGSWFGAQLLLLRHAQIAMFHDEVRHYHQFLAMHPTYPPLPPIPVHTRWWLQPAAESLVALVACAVVAAVIAAGGRRLWALLPAAFPLTLFLGVGDGNSLGLGWMQPFRHLVVWLRTGAAVDALAVAALAVLLSMLLPRRRATMSLAPAVLRTLPIAVIAFGYWYVGHPFPDDHDRLFVARTLLLVLAAAVIATLQLPLAVRVLTLFVVPFVDPNLSDGLIGGYTSWMTYLHHVGVGAATLLYVLGAPYLVKKAQDQARNNDGSARSAATSAMN